VVFKLTPDEPTSGNSDSAAGYLYRAAGFLIWNWPAARRFSP
jgi:hypothetical protein